MHNNITSYIDRCLIDEYANKLFYRGYSLEVDEIPKAEILNFLDLLMAHDSALREAVLDHMQTLIDKRLSAVEIKDRASAGLKLVQLSNGDKQLESIYPC
jgi:hypothetical protein